MEKQKRWQFFLIVAVIVLTLYNILPTIFYYTKPLKDPIDAARAQVVAADIAERTNSLEDYSKDWLVSFSKLLGIKPRSIELNPQDNRYFQVTFETTHDADLFKRFLPRAGEMVAFAPAQLSLHTDDSLADPKVVTVERHVGVHLADGDLDKIFQYAPKFEANGQISPLYKELIYDRAMLLALGVAGASKNARQMMAVVENSADPQFNDLVLALAKDIVSFDRVLGGSTSAAKRYFSTFSQANGADAEGVIRKFTARMDGLKASLEQQKQGILEREKKLKEDNQLLDSFNVQTLSLLDYQIDLLASAMTIVKKNQAAFQSGTKSLTEAQLLTLLAQSQKGEGAEARFQELSLNGHHPFIESLEIAWDTDQIRLKLYPDIQAIRSSTAKTEAAVYAKDQLDQMIINDIARLANQTDETITPNGDGFVVNLNQLPGSNSILALRLGYLAEKQAGQLQEEILSSWAPKHTDLVQENYPIRNYDTYNKESGESQKLGLVIYAPANDKVVPPEGFRRSSIYVIAKGLGSVMQKLRDIPQASEEGRTLMADFNALNKLLQQDGFIGYPGSSYGIAPNFRNDYIFELSDYYGNLLRATREDFYVRGSKHFAVLDFTDVEQRILALNKIEDRIQEDLLKWKDEYNASQVDLDATKRYTVPAPTQNPYWQNFKLAFFKYFRGDERKVLKWGLDLSGGKTVRIGLRDQNNRPVTDPDDLKQAVNELYTRINNMGVSERTIRIENENILLDFPGSQNLSANDLVKASAMYFHIVNEKFAPNNSALAASVNQFLQGVWNEAVVMNRRDIESINEIAWEHLGAPQDGQPTRPLSDEAKVLYDNGLRLANPKERTVSSEFNDTLSSVAIFRGDDYASWYGQTHPLLVVFHNYALEGSSLTGIQVGYDPSQGNLLMFGVKRSYEGRSGSPREDFYSWTSQFSEEKIAGTPKEAYSQGRGWRMAVILNGAVISAPTLGAALSDQATITGRFSQREVNQLAADLKAGSLSFTPRILSEQNVSPELGKEERFKGIFASFVALALVVIAMVAYYRFAGLVAACAVLFNLLIMWGVLQNLGAALTLPGIAGIVLTIGMAVDANVLVFERVREEFKISGRIASAIQAGYRKAFSAIIDSNITTLIAAVILIQFDSGPIKGFAVTLIIGIASSMFTALFMTRYFFAGWVQNPTHKSLTMSQFIHDTKFDFLAQKNKAIILSLIMIVIGGALFINQRATIFGMDFTGGYSLTVELQEQPNTEYRLAASEALLKHGATRNDVQIRELSRPNQLRIQLGEGMEERGHPFYQMPRQLSDGQFIYAYQKDPRLSWVVNALSQEGLVIPESQLNQLDANWTIMSGQLSDTMRNNAIIALAIALVSILVYITFRFEFKYALGAVIGLIHDVALTLGILALFHQLGFAVQIDLQVVGAIMTIIGYSLNDTIIVFDRIREDVKVLRKMPFAKVVNHALNVTLSRTLMTSGTTLLVLLALVLLGGQSIFAFSLVMTIGVVVGTLSSLFIASPVMLYFHNREHKEQDTEKRDGVELKRIRVEG